MHLPLLPLEVFRPRWCDSSDQTPHAVIDHGQVLSLCELARQAGIRHGMRRGGASALAPGLKLHERDAERERAALPFVVALVQFQIGRQRACAAAPHAMPDAGLACQFA